MYDVPSANPVMVNDVSFPASTATSFANNLARGAVPAFNDDTDGAVAPDTSTAQCNRPVSLDVTFTIALLLVTDERVTPEITGGNPSRVVNVPPCATATILELASSTTA